MDFLEGARHAKQECTACRHRRHAEKNGMQFGAIRPAANIAERGKPHEVRV